MKFKFRCQQHRRGERDRWRERNVKRRETNAATAVVADYSKNRRKLKTVSE